MSPCSTHENFLYAALRELKIKGVPALAFRMSYVGEQGWELHFKVEDGLVSMIMFNDGNLPRFDQAA